MMSDHYLLPNIQIYHSPLMLSFGMYYEIQVLILWVAKHCDNKIIVDGRKYEEKNKKFNA